MQELHESRRRLIPDFEFLEKTIFLEESQCKNIVRDYKEFLKARGELVEKSPCIKTVSVMYGYVTGAGLNPNCDEEEDSNITFEQIFEVAISRANFMLDREWGWVLPYVPLDCKESYNQDVSEEPTPTVEVSQQSSYDGEEQTRIGYNSYVKHNDKYHYRAHNFLTLGCEAKHTETFSIKISDVPYYIPDDNFIDENQDNHNEVKNVLPDTTGGDNSNTSERSDEFGNGGDTEEGATSSTTNNRSSNTSDDSTGDS